MSAFVIAVAFSAVDGGAVPVARDADEASLVSLIANPTAFNGQRVVVAGFAIFEHELSALFLRREDAERFIEANSIAISTDWPQNRLEPFHGKYVRCSAQFSITNDGKRGYLHSIENMRLAPVLERFPESAAHE